MAKRVTIRLLAVALVLAVGALGVHAAIHWHAHSYDEQHCRVCQIVHAAIPQPAAQVAVHAPVPVSRLALAEEFTPRVESVRTLSIPRAPPA